MNAPIRLGIVGLGVISKFYVEAIGRLPGFELAAVCDLRPQALEPFRARTATYEDHRTLLADGGVDAVVVNVPNDVHVAVCQDAVLAGTPVCVEKPLAITLDAGSALAQLAAERGVPLFTAFHRRYNSAVLGLVHELSTRHAANPVRELTVRYLERIEEHAGSDQWYLDADRCGGGCVADNGPNAFDLVRQLVGEVAVTDSTVVRDAHGTDRSATVELRATAGARARVELDWAYDGEVKDVTAELADGTVLTADMLAGHPEFKGSLWHEYIGVLRDFASRLPGGENSATGGLAALRLVDTVYRAEGVPA